MEAENPIDRLTKIFNCSQVELAERLGKSRQLITTWKKRGEIPPKEVLAISEKTGVSCHYLCPRYFPDQTK